MNKLWFLGGFLAMALIAVIGIKVASAAFTPETVNTPTAIDKPSCACGGEKSNCQGGCKMEAGKTCGCNGGKTGATCKQK